MTTQMRMDPYREMPLSQHMRVPAPGRVYYVDAASSGAADANDGTTPETAFLTIDYAIGQCTNLLDDYIFVIHHDDDTETYPITCDVSNVHIIGTPLAGTSRPRIRVQGGVDGFDVTANRVEIAGFNINTAVQGDTNRLVDLAVTANCLHFHDNYVAWNWWGYDGLYFNEGGSDSLINNNYFGAHGCSNYIVWTGSATGRVIFRDNVFILDGYQTGVRALNITSLNRCVVVNNQFKVPALANGEAISFMGEHNMATGNQACGPQGGFGAFNPYLSTLDNAYDNAWGVNYAGATPTLPIVA